MGCTRHAHAMNAGPVREPPIDVSLDHYMEERALAIALEKAATREEREKLERLMELRSRLMQHREAYLKEAVAKRHARGEFYSASRVAAINAMAPTRDELDANVRGLYLLQPTSEGVLKAHARTHFAQPLVSQRLMLADMPADIVEAARSIQAHEEAFAKAWVAAVGDPGFASQLREEQRQALALFRTASRPIHLVTSPVCEEFDDLDARELGRIWSRLDRLAESLGFAPLSHFIAFDDEADSAGVPALQLLPTVDALLSALARPERKFPSRRSAVALLARIRAALGRAGERGGRAHFEVDI